MPTAAEQVDAVFTQAHTYATAATTSLTGFTNALNAAAQEMTPPTVSFRWLPPDAPDVLPMPDIPSMPEIQFVEPDNIPSEFTETLPAVAIDTYIPPIPASNMPAAPEITIGSTPAVPAVADVTIPDAPELELPDLPQLMTLSPVTMGEINLHEGWLASLEDVPELDILAPTPYSYARGPEYASQLLSSLKAVLDERIKGGTGLDPVIEQAIWDRARGRELNVAQANIDEVSRTGEALGYPLPPGVLAEQLRRAQQNFHDKSSELSRDIAIKQADLEQANLKDAIASGMQLEGKLIDYSFQMESLAFESAKAAAENALGIYNAGLQQFNTLLEVYKTRAGSYKVLIEGELAKIEVFKAKLAGEQAKVDMNRGLVEQYKTQIEASMAHVQIYEAQVGAAKTLVDLEQAKLAAVGEQIKAFVAQINGETAKVEIYKAMVQGEAVKMDAFKSQAEAYAARSSTQAEFAKAQVTRFSALVQAKAAEWDGYRARIAAQSTKIEALGRQSEALVTGYRAHASAIEFQSNANIKAWDVAVTNYMKGRDVLLQTQKINGDFILATRAASLDAAKAGAQVYAQLTASSYGMMNASAGVSGQGSTSVSYNYGGEVAGTVPPLAGA